MLYVFLTPRQALSSHPLKQMVGLYWLQDRDSMLNWYTINHPTTLHTHNETVTHCCSPMAICTAGCLDLFYGQVIVLEHKGRPCKMCKSVRQELGHTTVVGG